MPAARAYPRLAYDSVTAYRAMARGCRCGGDMPGRCPGPANCPMCDSGPTCGTCGDEITRTSRATQDAHDVWTCEHCIEGEA